MFCVNCGKPYDPQYRFCNYCGASLTDIPKPQGNETIGSIPSVSVMSEPQVLSASVECPGPVSPISGALTSIDREPSQTGTVDTKPKPFVSLSLQYIGLLISSSILMVGMAERKAFSTNDAQLVSSALPDAVLVAAMVGVVVFIFCLVRTWKDVQSDPRSRRLAVAGTLYLTFVAAMLWMFGSTVGQNRRTIVAVQDEVKVVDDIATRIGAARSVDVKTIPEYISVYKGMEDDVDKYEQLNRKLETDLQEYSQLFPNQSNSINARLASTRTELRRAAILKKEIDLMKQIEPLDPAEQVKEWQSTIVPLAEEEDKLN